MAPVMFWLLCLACISIYLASWRYSKVPGRYAAFWGALFFLMPLLLVQLSLAAICLVIEYFSA
jgi:hypothetical protein